MGVTEVQLLARNVRGALDREGFEDVVMVDGRPIANAGRGYHPDPRMERVE